MTADLATFVGAGPAVEWHKSFIHNVSWAVESDG